MDIKLIIVKTLSLIVSILNEQEANPDYYLVTGDGKKIVFESKEDMDLYYEMNSPLKNRRQIPLGEIDNRVDNNRELDMRRMNELYMQHLRNKMRKVQ